MEPLNDSTQNTPHRSGSRTFWCVTVVIILLIAAFLILRPNPTTTGPGGTPAVPSSVK
ncbi:hypothetical protein [Granulicella sp. L60]|uniref:hypothetical protein n=1 Tax=Granulicella sp. L60 TaxID=1641866 RepID=UPI00131B81D3|nr:hypothetical protein [Granulicella sp. L60]